jgi:death-on-curing protein
MIRLTKQQVLLLHSHLIKATGGTPGLRDEHLLDSALSSPFMTFEGKDLFSSMFQKAARLCYGIAMNHPFVDGNKRTAIHVMLIFLSLNDIELVYNQEELIQTMLSVASGNCSVSELSEWIHSHQK